MRLPARIVSHDPPRKRALLFVGLCLFAVGCSRRTSAPIVTLTQLPSASMGGRTELATISGTVKGAKPGQQIVIYAKTDDWYVQPLKRRPYTNIGPDGHWQASIHLGMEYAALLVNPGFVPPPKISTLPTRNPDVLAFGLAGSDRVGIPPPDKVLHFSGYDWTTRRMESPRNGQWNVYDPENAWTDANGALHLRITHRTGIWTCAEVHLTRSLGYGTYRFTVHDVSQLGPVSAFSSFTFDEKSPDLNYREVAIEISRWGKPDNKNAQFVVQPYFISENVVRFDAPAGSLMNSFRWQPGRVSFTSQRALPKGARTTPIAEHVFTSGVPSPGDESIHLNLSIPVVASGQPAETEVVLDRFEYLP